MDIFYTTWISYIWHTYIFRPAVSYYFNHDSRFHLSVIRCILGNFCLLLRTTATKPLLSLVVAQMPHPGILIPAKFNLKTRCFEAQACAFI
jgi:hypothetical protein